jgi:hypothetical protein
LLIRRPNFDFDTLLDLLRLLDLLSQRRAPRLAFRSEILHGSVLVSKFVCPLLLLLPVLVNLSLTILAHASNLLLIELILYTVVTFDIVVHVEGEGE